MHSVVWKTGSVWEADVNRSTKCKVDLNNLLGFGLYTAFSFGVL